MTKYFATALAVLGVPALSYSAAMSAQEVEKRRMEARRIEIEKILIEKIHETIPAHIVGPQRAFLLDRMLKGEYHRDYFWFRDYDDYDDPEIEKIAYEACFFVNPEDYFSITDLLEVKNTLDKQPTKKLIARIPIASKPVEPVDLSKLEAVPK